jgi:hypothetical protein
MGIRSASYQWGFLPHGSSPYCSLPNTASLRHRFAARQVLSAVGLLMSPEKREFEEPWSFCQRGGTPVVGCGAAWLYQNDTEGDAAFTNVALGKVSIGGLQSEPGLLALRQ